MVKDRDDGDSDQDQSPQKDQDQDFRTSPLYLEKYKDSNPKGVALLSLMDKTGYNMVQINGQRTYGGPPPGWEGPPPPRGCEVFVGKIPRDMYEDELVPLFETAGKIYAFRLMMEFSGENRGYAFVMFTSREEAQRAIQMLDRYEIRPNKHLGVCVSLDNCRLFIGSIPKNKWKEDILEEMKKVTEGVVDVLVYPSSNDKTKNRGFAFVEYESHKAAALARRKLIPGGFQLWGQSVHANWAQPEKDVDEEVMQRIRVLFVRNLALSTSEKTLLEEFSRFKPGSVERVKKLMDYGFIHYHHREDALSALELMNGAVIDGSAIEVMLAKPANAHREAGASSGARARRFQGRGYLDNGNHANGSLGGAMATASGGGGGWAEFLMQGGGGVGDGPIRGLQDIYVSEHTEGVDRFMFPILPGTPLAPTSLASLKQSQIYSAQSLLEFLCMKNFWSPPEYHLYSAPGEDGRLLLLYKVVISSTQSTFVPDRLCLLLEDARELAARTTLWSLEPSVHRGLPLI